MWLCGIQAGNNCPGALYGSTDSTVGQQSQIAMTFLIFFFGIVGDESMMATIACHSPLCVSASAQHFLSPYPHAHSLVTILAKPDVIEPNCNNASNQPPNSKIK